MKRITLDGLQNVLSPKEMKNVIGGSGCCIIDHGGGGAAWGYCAGHDGDNACTCTNNNQCHGLCA